MARLSVSIILSVLVILRAVISSLEENGPLIFKSSRCITAIHAILGEMLVLVWSYSFSFQQCRFISKLEVFSCEKVPLLGQGACAYVVSDMANLLHPCQKQYLAPTVNTKTAAGNACLMPLQQKEQAEVMHEIVGDGKKWKKLCNLVLMNKIRKVLWSSCKEQLRWNTMAHVIKFCHCCHLLSRFLARICSFAARESKTLELQNYMMSLHEVPVYFHHMLKYW